MAVTNKQQNLDRLVAQCAQEVIRRTKKEGQDPGGVDNTITKTLGVLQENGVYACTLFLLSRTQEKNITKVITEEVLNLLDGLGLEGWERLVIRDDRYSEIILTHIAEKVTGGSLEGLLLAKETLEQMLIYARYGAKAWSAETGPNPEELTP